MPKLKLTKASVAKIAPGSGDWFDTDLTGFHVRAGAKWSTYRVRVSIGKKVLVATIGRADQMGIDEARKAAQIKIGELLKSQPQSTKQVKGDALTFGTALEMYLTRCEQQNRSPVTIKGYRSHAEKHLSDWLDVPLIELGNDRPRVEQRFFKVTDTSGPSMANAVMRVFRAVYTYAMRRYPNLPVAPTIVIEWHKDKPVKAAYSPDELPDVAKSLLEIDGRRQTRAHVHLLAFLTGCRGGALKSATWGNYDREGRTLYLPNHKGKPHTVRLSDALVSFLDMRRELVPANAQFVFPAFTKEGHVEDVRMPLPQSKRMAEYRASRDIKSKEVGTHVFRDTYISLSRAAGVSRDDCKRLVDHSIQQDAHAGYESDDAAHDYLVAQQEKMSAYLLEQAGLGADYRFAQDDMLAHQMI